MKPIVATEEHRPQPINAVFSDLANPLSQLQRVPYQQTGTSGQCPNAVSFPVSNPERNEASKSATEAGAASQALINNFRGAGSSYKSKRVFKVIIIGDAGVGKTCLSYRFCNGRFPGTTEATIGVDFRERSLAIEDELIRVQLWDTAGQERYRQSIVAHYYRNVNAVVFVYDVNNPQSFKSLPAWIAECKKHALTSGADTPHILVGNKCDLAECPGERVKTDQAQMFADENDMALFETSALSDSEADHVESIFITLVHKLRQSKAMHVQTSEERSRKEKQKILLKAGDAAKLGEEEEEAGGMCC